MRFLMSDDLTLWRPVVGHGACGKTSLVDALAFVSGSSTRPWAVKDGT
jgi:AAA15 family ATPase/GTPase